MAVSRFECETAAKRLCCAQVDSGTKSQSFRLQAARGSAGLAPPLPGLFAQGLCPCQELDPTLGAELWWVGGCRVVASAQLGLLNLLSTSSPHLQALLQGSTARTWPGSGGRVGVLPGPADPVPGPVCGCGAGVLGAPVRAAGVTPPASLLCHVRPGGQASQRTEVPWEVATPSALPPLRPPAAQGLWVPSVCPEVSGVGPSVARPPRGRGQAPSADGQPGWWPVLRRGPSAARLSEARGPAVSRAYVVLAQKLVTRALGLRVTLPGPAVAQGLGLPARAWVLPVTQLLGAAGHQPP